MVLLKMVLIMFIGAVFTANASEEEKIVEKVAARYCKNNLDVKDKLAYMKCDNIIEKGYRERIYDCIKKYEDHSRETSMKPMLCYYVNNRKPETVQCITDYEKERFKTEEEKEKWSHNIDDFKDCIIKLPIDSY